MNRYLTNEIVEEIGFKKINNSMWRFKDCTIQNCYSHSGTTLLEKCLSTKKAYKVCICGKYLRTVVMELELKHIINLL